MKSLSVAAAVFFSSLLILSTTPTASAIDMNAVLVPSTNVGHVVFIADKSMEMTFPKNSSIAGDIVGRTDYRFTVSGNIESVDNGIADAIVAFNRAFLASQSPVRVEEMTITYSSSVRETATGALVSVRIVSDVHLDNFILGHDNNRAMLDLEFRSIKVTDLIVLHSEEVGSIEITRPIGILDSKYPAAAEKIRASGLAEIFDEPIINFSAFDLPISRWHALFDPTGSQIDAAGIGFEEIGDARVISIFSMGESSFREGVFEDERKTATASIDGAQVTVNSLVSRPSGSIHIAGYATVANYGGEVAYVSPDQPGSGYGLGFTLQVLLILGGMMGAIAVMVLWKTRK